MLEPILKGLVQWIYEMMVDIMAYASGELLGVMNMDLSYFEKTAPIISDIVTVIIALGWALLLGNMVFQLMKSIMSGIGFEGEDPKMIFLRTFVFAFLLLASRQICEIGLSITGTVIDMLGIPDSIMITTPDESMFGLGSGAKWLLVIIVGVILMVQMVKLLFEIGERYVVMSVLTFFAPLAFSMGGSRNTNDIFKGWCRMYGSMMVMMIMNIVFLKLIMSAMLQMASGGVLIWLVFVVALTRVARKIDSHIGKIGLNPAQTGDAIGGRFPGAITMMAVRVMSSAIGKSIAANKSSGSGRKRSGERRHGASGMAAGIRNLSGDRHAGGANAYANMANTSQSSGGNTNSGQNSSSVYGNSSTSSRTTQGGNVQNQNSTVSDRQNKKAGNTPYGGNYPSRVDTNADVPQNLAKNPHTQANTVGGMQNMNHQNQTNIGGAQPTNRPPLDRKTGPGGTYSRVGIVKTGTANGKQSQQGGHAAGTKEPPIKNQLQFKGGPGNNGNKTEPGGIANITKDGRMVSSEKSAAVRSQKSVQSSTKQSVGNANRQSHIMHSGQSQRDVIQRSEKLSDGHTENSSGMRETLIREREGNDHSDRQSKSTVFAQQTRELHSKGRVENRINHAYKRGKYNPSAENQKTKKSYYKKQRSVEQKEHSGRRHLRKSYSGNGGEDNRKRKWEK